MRKHLPFQCRKSRSAVSIYHCYQQERRDAFSSEGHAAPEQMSKSDASMTRGRIDDTPCPVKLAILRATESACGRFNDPIAKIAETPGEAIACQNAFLTITALLEDSPSMVLTSDTLLAWKANLR